MIKNKKTCDSLSMPFNSPMKAPMAKVCLSLSVLAFIFGFSYWYPRWLTGYFGENSPWVSFFYTYGMGLVFFILSLIWIFTRPKINFMRQKQELYWLLAINCGLLFMLSLHALWIWRAIHFPFKN